MEKQTDNLTWKTDREDLITAVRNMSKECLITKLTECAASNAARNHISKMRHDQLANTMMIKLLGGEVEEASIL